MKPAASFAETGTPSQDGVPVSIAAPVVPVRVQLRVVFDTNVLLSLFVFDDSRFAPLLGEIDAGRWQGFSSDACFAEFQRVLAYRQFGLSAERQEAAACAWRQRLLLASDRPRNDVDLPRCSDRDDQKFLELARNVGADWLVTADKALLKLARRDKLRGLFRILTPDVALASLE